MSPVGFQACTQRNMMATLDILPDSVIMEIAADLHVMTPLAKTSRRMHSLLIKRCQRMHTAKKVAQDWRTNGNLRAILRRYRDEDLNVTVDHRGFTIFSKCWLAENEDTEVNQDSYPECNGFFHDFMLVTIVYASANRQDGVEAAHKLFGAFNSHIVKFIGCEEDDAVPWKWYADLPSNAKCFSQGGWWFDDSPAGTFMDWDAVLGSVFPVQYIMFNWPNETEAVRKALRECLGDEIVVLIKQPFCVRYWFDMMSVGLRRKAEEQG